MEIARLYVSLRGIEPPIWRRIELSPRTTLKQLHRILQIAMGWQDYHLHEYIADGQRYGVPSPEYDEPGEVIREGGVRIAELLPSVGTEILYTYDFGDCWQHDIQLEAFGTPEPDAHYPRIVAGARSCPPEDCGGTSGYANLLEVLLDPAHEEFDHLREWAGSEFNAEVYSVDSANSRLRRNRSLTIPHIGSPSKEVFKKNR